MRIHTKLFLLLLVISVLPLVALSLRGQRATDHGHQRIDCHQPADLVERLR